MSETPPPEPVSVEDELSEPVADPLPTQKAEAAPSPEPPRPSKSSQWLTLAALVIAVIAVAGAAFGYFFPQKSASSAPTYSDQQQKDAKKQICETFKIVKGAAGRGTRPPFKLPKDAGPVAVAALVTYQQLAYFGGGALLRDQLNLKPATPSDLANAAGEVATGLEDLGMEDIAGTRKEFARHDALEKVAENMTTLDGICKKDAPPK